MVKNGSLYSSFVRFREESLNVILAELLAELLAQMTRGAGEGAA